MIVVDSSVWIDNLRANLSEQVLALRNLSKSEVLVGDIVLLEVLRGARDDLHSQRIEREMRQFPMAPMLDPVLAVVAAHNFRLLRAVGVTVHKTTDLIIATFCMEHGHTLLHSDRDFIPFERHLNLRSMRI